MAFMRRVGTGILVLVMMAFFSLRANAADPIGDVLGNSIIWTGKALPAKSAGIFVAFRKQFDLPVIPEKITMHLFADTRYMLWVNGRYVDRGPCRFEPRAPEYDSINLTPFLHQGSNTLAILVTAHISNGKTRLHDPCLTARLVAQNGDRTDVICATDPTWKWSDQTRYREAKTDWPNVYDIVDARTEDGDFTQLEYDDHAWAGAVPVTLKRWGPLSARRIPLLRETAVIPEWQASTTWPTTLHAGEQISFQFPRLVLAYTQLDLEADAGSEIELTYSKPTRYVCRAGVQSYISTDTHSIFDGAIRVKSGRVTLKNVKFVERLYPFDRVGSFHSNDPLLDKLFTTCLRGFEVTSEDAYIDCADRERVEWMDCDPPAFDVTRIAMAGPEIDGTPAWADPRLLEEMLRRTAYTLQPAGWVKAHTSSDRFDIHAKMEDRACDWVEGARRYYESCGKTDVIREIWPAIVSQMNYFLARRTERGLVRAREWVVWGDPVGYRTCEGTALNAFIYRALADAAFLGNIIGEKEQAATFDAAAKALGGSINTTLWNEKAGTYYAGYDAALATSTTAPAKPKSPPLHVADHLIEPTRHAALFTLDQNVVPENRRRRVTQFLLAHPPTDNAIMQYYYFFKQQYAQDDPTQDLSVLSTIRAQWKDMAYSRYEATFEGLHAVGGSSAHAYGDFPAFFLSAYVLGVRIDGPVQNKTILIEPRLGDLAEAAGTVITEFGPADVSWKKSAGTWNFSLEVPDHITTRLRLPVGGGTFTASLDDKILVPASMRNGRWLEVTLHGGTHRGSWRSE